MRRFSALTWLRGIDGFAAQFTGLVPGEFWTEDVENQTRVAIISCVCGQTPSVPENRITICDGEDCGRVFLLLGDTVRVARIEPDAQAPQD